MQIYVNVETGEWGNCSDIVGKDLGPEIEYVTVEETFFDPETIRPTDQEILDNARTQRNLRGATA